MNGLFETIFWVQFYCFDEICLPGGLNECAEASLYALYKTTFQVSLSYWLNELCLLGDLNKCAEASLHTLYRTICWVSLSYWLNQLDLQRPKQTSQVFPSIIKKQSFQNHLATKTIISTWSFTSCEDGSKLCPLQIWTNEPSIPQCHWEMVFSKPTCH